MSAIERADQTADSTLSEYPTFELCYLYDDKNDPTEVTLFAPDTAGDPSTRWITADRDDVVPLEDVQ